jgi:hypothetical protein
MNDMLVIVPSRGRPKNQERFLEYFFKNSTISDICFALDTDDESNYPRFDKVIYEVLEPFMLNEKLNAVSYKYCNSYKFIAFIGDDHLLQTYAWDKTLTDPLLKKVGVSYGNDLYKKEELPTCAVLSSNIIKHLGYMAPPELKHSYIDKFWLDLGTEIGNINYFENVIWEHIHPDNKKTEVDKTYLRGWSTQHQDKENYILYKKNRFEEDLKKIKGILSE